MKKILHFFMSLLTICLPVLAFPLGTWTQKADLPGPARYGASAFTIGEKGYIGMGCNGTGPLSDLWEYVPSANTWTQKAGLPDPRFVCASFAIGTKGYICLGLTEVSSPVTKEVWEYDAPLNAWTKKGDFPGKPRYGAAGFSLQRKGYICCGNEGPSAGPFSNELWEYDPVSDLWTRKADFPGDPREGMSFSGFGIGEKEYIGLGSSDNGNGHFGYHTFYSYDPLSDTWTQIADYPGRGTGYAAGFTSCGKGFVGTGSYAGSTTGDYWQYDPDVNKWTEAARFPGARRCMMAACTIGGKGFVGTGYDFAWYYGDWWEFSCLTSGVTENPESDEYCIYPNPAGNQLTVGQLAAGKEYCLRLYDCYGKIISTSIVNHKNNTIALNAAKGVYFIEIIADEERRYQRVIIE